MAKELITNYSLPSIYTNKINFYINSKKLKYVQNSMRKIDTKSGKAYKRVLGTADINTGVIRITSYCWEVHHNDMRLVDYQIKHTLLHEIQHIISHNSLHPGGTSKYNAKITTLMGGR